MQWWMWLLAGWVCAAFAAVVFVHACAVGNERTAEELMRGEAEALAGEVSEVLALEAAAR